MQRHAIDDVKATAHLLHGFIGSGKTTFARQLEVELPAVRFTLDEWMVERHGQNPPEATFKSLYEALSEQLWQEALAMLSAGTDVILDTGFWSYQSRVLAREKILSLGAVPKFYKVSCPRQMMRERTLQRSSNPPMDSLWIDGAAFDKLWAGWEPMSDDEDFVEVDTSGCHAVRDGPEY